MATDTGLGYLSGLLRAGAEPLGPVGGAPRRRAAAPPRVTTSPHAPPSHSPAPSDRTAAGEAPHPLDAGRSIHATASQTSADDAPALRTVHEEETFSQSSPAEEVRVEGTQPTGFVTEHTAVVTKPATVAASDDERPSGTPRRLTVEWSPPAVSEETLFAEQSEGFATSRTVPTNTTLDEDATESVAPGVPPSPLSPRTRAASAPLSNTETGVENQPRETTSGDAPPSFTSDARTATEVGREDTTPSTRKPSSFEPTASNAEHEIMPATSRVVGAVVEARAVHEEETFSQPSPEEEIRVEETTGFVTERIAVVTKHATVVASDDERPSSTPRRLTVEWSPSPLEEETTNSAASQAATTPATEGTTTHTAGTTTTTTNAPNTMTDSASIVPDTPSARGVAARHKQPARVFQASPGEVSPRLRESDPALAFESDSARTGESAERAADSTLYTLEAHVEQLRALMQTRRAETPGASGVDASAVAGRQSADGAAKETPTPRAPAWRARESPPGEQRVEFRPAASSTKSASRQTVVLASSERIGAAAGRRTSATEPPPRVSPAEGAQTTVAAAASHGQKGKKPSAHASAARPASAPAATTARVGGARPREGGRTSETKADGGARTPKLTINRLDVQVVNRAEAPQPPTRPARTAPASPSRPDPWGAPDRHFLGRFFH